MTAVDLILGVKSSLKVKEYTFKVVLEVSEQSMVIRVGIQPKGLKTLTLRHGLEFHIQSTPKSQITSKGSNTSSQVKQEPIYPKFKHKTTEVN